MIWLCEHGDELFILFLFPIIGLAFDYRFSKRINLYVLVASAIFLCPILTGYSYISLFAYPFFALIFLGSGYSFYLRTLSKVKLKLFQAIGISALILPIFACFAFMATFSGTRDSVREWDIDNYNVKYIYDQGFSGGTLKKYELSKYGLFKIFIKPVDVVVDNDPMDSCNSIFIDSKMVFNKCSGTLKKID